jgi:hypothetical protein
MKCKLLAARRIATQRDAARRIATQRDAARHSATQLVLGLSLDARFNQVYQMVYFQNPDLECLAVKNIGNYLAVWSILPPFHIFYGHLV